MKTIIGKNDAANMSSPQFVSLAFSFINVHCLNVSLSVGFFDCLAPGLKEDKGSQVCLSVTIH